MKPIFVRRAFLVLGLCSLAACRKAPAPAQSTEATPRLASEVAAGDEKAAAQLASGFYQVEAGAWRWTAQQFAVVLGVPSGAARRGGKLSLAITVPPPVIEKLGSTTLSASVGGTELAPEIYTKPGPYTYQREIAPALLSGESIRIDFRLDRALPPAGADIRELGIIVLRATLISK